MGRADDDVSFEELMAMEGVTPLSGRDAPASPRRPKGTPEPVPGAPMQAPAAATAPTAPAAAARAATSPSSGAPAPSSLDRLARPRPEEVEARQAQARAATAEAALADARRALEESAAESRALATERSRLDERCRRLHETVRAHERREARHTALRELLAARGLANQDEMIDALVGLLSVRPAELLDTVEVANPEALSRMLDQRLALVHDPDGGYLGDACVAVQVPAERCEITGGSDIRAAFHRLVMAGRGCRPITIVGGSPAYRRQLEHLAESEPGALALNLVSGTQRRTRRKAEADMRKSELIVIWGATELDHSVSGVYSSGPAPILRVPHRGISRMLEHVAAWLEDHAHSART
ncbi:hypothetical protein [Haliangium sp.]|uniref:hypothetical protein n=1 Tax=Haliangium sp. TaxID=2663208 RepID=UPI003D0B40DA